MPFLGSQPETGYKTVAKQDITGTGATVYTLDYKVATAAEVEVFVNNVRQEPEVAYTVSGNQITFTTAVDSGDDCYVVFQGRAVTSNLIESQNIADGSVSAAKTNFIDSNGFYVPTLASDPSSAVAGQMYYNTTDGVVKNYNGNKWLQMSNQLTVNGGSKVISGGYAYHTFTTSGTFEISGGTLNIEWVAIGGGGGGGNARGQNWGAGGGGGAGGYVTGSASLNSASHSVVIGAGGAGGSTPGTTSDDAVSGSNTTFNSITSIGGGRGGAANFIGANGGSGGGTGYYRAGTSSGTTGQGYGGGDASSIQAGGGGGGASAAGANATGTSTRVAGNGGAGAQWLDGNYYAGGGGGGIYTGDSPSSATTGSGGIGGGGNGGDTFTNTLSLNTGKNATTNTGSGGGGGSGYNDINSTGGGGNGGSGIVIIRYAI